MKAAEELPCPLHGSRIPNPSVVLYKAKWMADDQPIPDWKLRSPAQREQYEKAARATRAYLEGRK